jgi:membrane protein implicated in regulation of membrane protease activity
VPFAFLILSLSAYIYVVLRVVVGFEVPALYTIGFTNDDFFIGLILVIGATLLANLAWRTYLRQRLKRDPGLKIGEIR